LDVRDDIHLGREPFSRIMGTVSRLRPDEKLRLVAPFEPVPLFAVLARQGFSHSARQIDHGDWEVLFERKAGQASRLPGERDARVNESCVGSADAGRRDACPSSIDVDARGLEPPQPMVKILEALTTLPAGAGLRARTDRRPMHLYAHLEERGFVGETSEQTDGSFLTHIHRR
jgi:uncharacterized protein (DUF2249 family)